MDEYTRDSVYDNFITMVGNKAIEIFGENIADPIHEPIRFAFQMRVVESTIKREVRNVA